VVRLVYLYASSATKRATLAAVALEKYPEEGGKEEEEGEEEGGRGGRLDWGKQFWVLCRRSLLHR